MAQKNPDLLIDKLVSFVLQVRRLVMKQPYDAADIIATDETPVWADMASATTVDDTHRKKCNCKNNWRRKNSCFRLPSSKTNNTKLLPFIVFKGAKVETAELDHGLRTYKSLIR